MGALSRWVGHGDGTWVPPGTVDGIPPTLHARVRLDDGVAVERIARIGLESTCALGTVPDTFPADSVGWSVAAVSCATVGRPELAELVRAHAPGNAPIPDLDRSSLAAAVRPITTRLDVRGESLSYSFLHPELLEVLPQFTSGTPGASFEERVGTDRWSEPPQASMGVIPEGSFADIELAAETAIAAWETSLRAMPREQLAAGLRPVVLGWVRAALYEGAGERALRAGTPGTALPLLDEVAGGPRPRPSLGQHPVLLSGIAYARWASGEHARAAELLHAIAAQPGWEFAAAAAESVARVAVLPSATDPRVRR